MKKSKGIIASFYVVLLAIVACLAVSETIEDHDIKAVAPPPVQEQTYCDVAQEMFDSVELENTPLGKSQKKAINNYLCKPIEVTIAEDEPSTLIIEPNRVYAGQAAVDIVTQLEGELTPEMIRVVLDEGYVMGEYHDVGEVYASGVGQTGKFKGMSFKESFEVHVERAQEMFPYLSIYSEELRANIISSTYRGSMSGSPKTRMLINAGRFKEAAVEFLNNDEYRKAKASGSGVAQRMERVANAIANEPSVYKEIVQKE